MTIVMSNGRVETALPSVTSSTCFSFLTNMATQLLETVSVTIMETRVWFSNGTGRLRVWSESEITILNQSTPSSNDAAVVPGCQRVNELCGALCTVGVLHRGRGGRVQIATVIHPTSTATQPQEQ